MNSIIKKFPFFNFFNFFNFFTHIIILVSISWFLSVKVYTKTRETFEIKLNGVYFQFSYVEMQSLSIIPFRDEWYSIRDSYFIFKLASIVVIIWGTLTSIMFFGVKFINNKIRLLTIAIICSLASNLAYIGLVAVSAIMLDIK